MKHGLTEEQLANLTEEELAGLEQDEEEEAEAAEAEAAASAEADEQAAYDAEAAKKQQQKDDKAAADQKAADEAAAAAAAAAEAEKAKETNQQQAPERKQRPLLTSDANVEDIDRQLAALKEGKEALAAKFDEGEITFSDMQKQLNVLTDNEYELREAKMKANLAQEVSQNQEAGTWEQACDTFLNAHKEIAGDLKMASFDFAVRMVTGDPANANLSYGEALQKAYDNWATELGIKPANDNGQQKAPDKKEPEKKPKQGVVPTLGAAPAADANDTDDGEFGWLDRLAESDPLRYEAELMKMSDAKREAYLQS